jgi:hypothetical protein
LLQPPCQALVSKCNSGSLEREAAENVSAE